MTEKTITKMYGLRWEVENSFRDFTQTIRLEQWHSKFINGIRQELYVALVLYNFVKLKILSKFDTAKECMKDVYRKPNFKLLFGWITSRLYKIFKGIRDVMKDFDELLEFMTSALTERHLPLSPTNIFTAPKIFTARTFCAGFVFPSGLL